jgi:hypothetical protein
MRKGCYKAGEGAELQFRFAESWGFLKGALESGWGDKSPEFVPASDKIKRLGGLDRNRRLQENLPMISVLPCIK